MRRFFVNLDVFCYKVEVIICPRAELKPLLGETRICDIPDEAKGCYFPETSQHYPTIWLERPPTTPPWHSLLAHETIHAVLAFMRLYGMNTNEETEEVICYATQFIIRNTLEQLRGKPNERGRARSGKDNRLKKSSSRGKH